MGKDSIMKQILAAAFALLLFVGFLKSGSYDQIGRLFDNMKQNPEESVSINTIDSEFASSMWKQRELIDLNGSMAKRLKMQGFYSDMGMYITDEDYIVSASPYTSTDYEYDQIISFNEFLKENGVKLLYVNIPTKYTEDSLFSENFGVESFSNRNMDHFLERIREAGIPTIDLRKKLADENRKVSELFYRTDHHWTVRAGLWATRIMAEGLNEYCGYNIDLSVYDEDKYEFTEWKNCWLGEQGKKVAETYVGRDDFTEIKPKFATSYTIKSKDGNHQGTFDSFINESVFNTEKDVYESKSWHYAYQQLGCINNNVQEGKVLFLGDSFGQVTEPFFSLGVHEVDPIILRSFDDTFSLRNYILENGYDTVLINYGQFMLGAHDNPSSANYRMFTFEY